MRATVLLMQEFQSFTATSRIVTKSIPLSFRVYGERETPMLKGSLGASRAGPEHNHAAVRR
jgi:hypothetical protein